MRPPAVLTISASESDGAAGIQADLKTLTALGVYGASVLTMVRATNTQGSVGTHYVPATVVQAQLGAVVDDLFVDATKVGALGTESAVSVVAEAIKQRRKSFGWIVVDPVMVSSDGSAMISAEGARAIAQDLVPLADVLTPNIAEAAQLLGRSPATSIDEVREHALALQARGPRAVLVTGGGLDGDEAVDVLVHPGGTDVLRAKRAKNRRPRGAGDTLSAAIAAQMARIEDYDRAGELGEIGEAGEDDDLFTVVASAREFLASTIHHASDWQVSRQGRGPHGPVNHLITLDGE